MIGAEVQKQISYDLPTAAVGGGAVVTGQFACRGFSRVRGRFLLDQPAATVLAQFLDNAGNVVVSVAITRDTDPSAVALGYLYHFDLITEGPYFRWVYTQDAVPSTFLRASLTAIKD